KSLLKIKNLTINSNLNDRDNGYIFNRNQATKKLINFFTI
ncbi:hypothetical protein Q142_02655, partial [Staphylococcus aureus M1136]